MTTMRTEVLRQSDRVSFRIQLAASCMATSGMVSRIAAVSLLVSRNGGVVRITEKFFPGQEISLKRLLDGDSVRTARARILAEIDREPEGFLYAVHILEPRSDFWDIEFPAPHKADQEALAVCEDLSKGGIAFRSRNEYPKGTRVEVAVPFTPGAGAIFVPIRIVFSEPIRSAGLFRHGAAYLKPPE